MADRGQSEVLGFAMLFGVVLLMILVVTASASGDLIALQEVGRVDNAETAMVAFADNVEDLARGEAPSRATEVALDGGRLSLGDPVEVTVDGTSVDGSGASFSATFDLRPLVYRSPDGTVLVYLDRSVVRDDGHGVATIHGSAHRLSTDRVVLTFVRFERAGRTDAVGGDHTASVATRRNGTAVVAVTDEPFDVTLTLTSSRAGAWARELGDRPGVDCSLSGDTATCSVRADRVSVAIVDVVVEFD